MSIDNEDRADEYPLIIKWRDLYGQRHKLKIKYNVDKADGFYYHTCQIDDDTSFVISKFDGDKWRLANVLSGDKKLKIKEEELADKLGELGDLYNKLGELLRDLSNQE